jgi:signal peptidase I
MFGFFPSQDKKMRENAANWLELADKVYHFRRDLLTANQVAELQSRTADLKAQVKEKAGAEKLKLAIERLEEVLRRTGGAIYPKSALVENVEFFLVAAIVILGIRTYFVQPFKIPTNSMWPTYNGMTAEVWRNSEAVPSLPAKLARFALFGARHHEVVAPASGQVAFPITAGGTVYFTKKPARSWLIFPSLNRLYTFQVGGQEVQLQVPEDFDFDTWVVENGLGFSRRQLAAKVGPNESGRWVPLDLHAEAGKPFLSFDILTGDQLFVDRVSYHFMRPKVGQGFVFRTGNIEGIGQDQYYIKRLIGVPGDRIEIKEPVVYRNGAPITGAEAFDLNARRVGKYRGYFNATPESGARYLFPGEQLNVPEDKYFAMGDNSGNSADGRYWGFVPAKDVVGRPLFVYFPFTRHWGPAK